MTEAPITLSYLYILVLATVSTCPNNVWNNLYQAQNHCMALQLQFITRQHIGHSTTMIKQRVSSCHYCNAKSKLIMENYILLVTLIISNR